MGRDDSVIGRAYESRALRVDLETALGGEGRIVWLEGEPGIGKTFLASRLAADAEARGADCVWGRCREQADTPEYWPWIQALAASDDEGAHEAARVLAPGVSAEPTQPLDPARVRFERFDAVGRALADAARRRPRVILLDDLQWSDAGSLELLAYLAPDLSALPILVVVALRQSDDARLARLRSLARELVVHGLSPEETAELVARETGRRPAAELVEQLHQLTSGNPFFVTEMAQLLPVADEDDAGTALPPRVKEILARRIASIPKASRDVLRTAAVFGVEFRLEPLARALGRPLEAVLAELEAPLASTLVEERPGALQAYAFCHALMRDTLYEGLSKPERARAHQTAAQALEALGGESGDRIFELSHHFFEAARSGDPAPAVRYACEAGERALERLAFETAARHFARALAALELVDDASPDDRLRIRLGYGMACRWTESPEAAAPHLREAIALARDLGPVRFAETALRVALERAEFQVLDIEMNALLEEALRRLPDEPSSVRARLLAQLAFSLHLAPDSERRRLEMAQAAIDMARTLGDGPALAFARSRHLATLLTPDQREARARAVAGILGDADTTPPAELEALLYRANDLAEAADRKGLDAALAVFEQRAQASGSPFFLWQVESHRVALALLEGRFPEAEALSRAALAHGQRVSPQSAGIRFSQQLLWLRSWQARLAEVAPLVEHSVRTARIGPAWRCALAGFYSHAGRDAEARREFEALAATDFDMPRDSTWLIGTALIADVAVRLGDRERARRLQVLLRPYGGRIAVAGPLVVLNSLFDMRLGSLALLLDEHDEAVACFEQAMETAERMRALPWQAEARYYLGRALGARAATGDAEQALARLEEAEAIAKPVGMTLLSGWISEARSQVRRRVGRVAVATGTDGREARDSNVVPLSRARAGEPSPAVFRREGDVWSLVYEGTASRFRHMRGLAHIARLLAEPDREFHASELAGTPAQADAGDAGEQLDAHARSEYEARLRDARDELEEAEQRNDRGRAEQATREIEWLSAELTRGFGLGGRARRAGSASERARTSVTRAIKYAIDKIEAHDPALADYLRRNVRTGTFCVYAPPSRNTITWNL